MSTTTQNIGINISSSVGGALPGINSVNSSLQALSASSTLAARGLNGLTPVTNNAARGMASLQSALTSGGRTLSQFSITAAGVQRNLVNTVQPANRAGNAIQNLGRVASDAPFGFIAIQNNLDPLLQSFRSLQAQTGSTGAALRELGKGLIGGAGLGLAFSVVSSVITTLIQKYGSLGNAIATLNPFISDSARNQLALNKALLDGSVAGQKEVANLQLLYKASQDVNIPLGERKKIVDELQRQFPDTFKNLSDETILAGGAAKAYDELTRALTAQAAVKATTELAAEQLKGIAKLKVEANTLNDELEEIRNPKGGRGIFGNTDPIRIARDVDSKLMDINKNRFEQVQLEKNLADIQKVQLDLVDKYGAKVLGISAIPEPKALKVKIEKTDADKIKEIVDGISQDFLRLDTVFAATGGEAKSLSEDRIPILTSALAQLSTLGVVPGTGLFDDIKSQIDQLKAAVNGVPVTLKIPIVIDPLPAATNSAAIQAVTDGIKENFQRNLIDVSKIVNETLKSQLAEGIASVAQGIGEAFSGGGIKSALSGFVNAISSFGQSLGKQLIAQGVALLAFNASLKSLNGTTSIIAGAALIAASAAFKNFAGKGVGSFATGGTAIGPQLALIGDNPGREEHIIPSEVLDKMSGGDGGVLETRFSVNEMIIWLNRGMRNNG